MDKIRIVSNIIEFNNELQNSEIVGFLQPGTICDNGYEGAVLKTFEDPLVNAAYSDVIISTEDDTYLHIYNQFHSSMFKYHPIILSPLFIRSKDINTNFDIEYLWTHILLKDNAIFGFHIPNILFNISIDKQQQNMIKSDIEKINNNTHDKTISSNI